MKLPVVTIVGRRNVGKSTLFNTLLKERKAIVDPVAGLTRDVVSCRLTHGETTFTLNDTPGLDLPGDEELSRPILDNAREHLSHSHVVIFLLEYPAPDSYDYELAELLRKLGKPVIAAVNKMEGVDRMEQMAEFFTLGFPDIFPISATRNYNIDMLLERLRELLPNTTRSGKEPDLSLALVGRPNAGKSTLLNAYMGKNRAVVSDVPGTTRDAVDDEFAWHGKNIRIIDTAGIRKKSRFKDDVEYFSLDRTREAIGKSDVVVHLLDATMGITDTDKKISDIILKAHKPIVIAVNKWDAVEKDDKSFDQLKDKIIHSYYRAADFPIISISASSKQRINRVLETGFTLKEKSSRRIETPELNRAVARLVSSNRLPQMGHKIRIYYLTQYSTTPPSFKLFVNDREYFRKDVIRYLEKSLQETFDLKGVPLVIKLEDKKKDRKS